MTAKLSAAKYRQLEQATDYATWRTHAVDLDAQSDMDVWKTNPHSPHYQHQLIQQRLINLRAWRKANDWPQPRCSTMCVTTILRSCRSPKSCCFSATPGKVLAARR